MKKKIDFRELIGVRDLCFGTKFKKYGNFCLDLCKFTELCKEATAYQNIEGDWKESKEIIQKLIDFNPEYLKVEEDNQPLIENKTMTEEEKKDAPETEKPEEKEEDVKEEEEEEDEEDKEEESEE